MCISFAAFSLNSIVDDHQKCPATPESTNEKCLSNFRYYLRMHSWLTLFGAFLSEGWEGDIVRL